MPATETSETSRIPMVAAAQSRAVTRRWIGFTAITSSAEISSRILRDPRSAVIAEPPAPEISSAVATGAASRTMARTMAAPVPDSAPSWRAKLPTCRAMTMPKGIDTRMTGSVVTLAMNHD